MGSDGNHRVTLEDADTASRLVSHGFHFEDRHFFPVPFELVSATQVHIHDAPVWITDAVVESVLAPYGKVVGAIRHGRHKLANGKTISTGVRFCTFELKRAIPSFVSSPNGTHQYRIYYAGQQQTCRLCSATDHLSKDCQMQSSNGHSTSSANSRTRSRGWEQPENRDTTAAPTKPVDKTAQPSKSSKQEHEVQNSEDDPSDSHDDEDSSDSRDDEDSSDSHDEEGVSEHDVSASSTVVQIDKTECDPEGATCSAIKDRDLGSLASRLPATPQPHVTGKRKISQLDSTETSPENHGQSQSKKEKKRKKRVNKSS